MTSSIVKLLKHYFFPPEFVPTYQALALAGTLDALPVAVVFLDAMANTLEALSPLVPELLTALESLQPRQFVTIKH